MNGNRIYSEESISTLNSVWISLLQNRICFLSCSSEFHLLIVALSVGIVGCWASRIHADKNEGVGALPCKIEVGLDFLVADGLYLLARTDH